MQELNWLNEFAYVALSYAALITCALVISRPTKRKKNLKKNLQNVNKGRTD